MDGEMRVGSRAVWYSEYGDRGGLPAMSFGRLTEHPVEDAGRRTSEQVRRHPRDRDPA